MRIAKDLGPSMKHFTSDCEAIVVASYDQEYGGRSTPTLDRNNDPDNTNYTLHLKGRGKSSWYYGHQLTLLEADRQDLLQAWEDEEATEALEKGSLDRIFSHGDEVLKGTHGATVAALAQCCGLTDLWGPHGEGITYMTRSMNVMQQAKPYLAAGDKEGWLKHAEELKSHA